MTGPRPARQRRASTGRREPGQASRVLSAREPRRTRSVATREPRTAPLRGSGARCRYDQAATVLEGAARDVTGRAPAPAERSRDARRAASRCVSRTHAVVVAPAGRGPVTSSGLCIASPSWSIGSRHPPAAIASSERASTVPGAWLTFALCSPDPSRAHETCLAGIGRLSTSEIRRQSRPPYAEGKAAVGVGRCDGLDGPAFVRGAPSGRGLVRHVGSCRG